MANTLYPMNGPHSLCRYLSTSNVTQRDRHHLHTHSRRDRRDNALIPTLLLCTLLVRVKRPEDAWRSQSRVIMALPIGFYFRPLVSYHSLPPFSLYRGHGAIAKCLLRPADPSPHGASSLTNARLSLRKSHRHLGGDTLLPRDSLSLTNNRAW